MGLVLDIRLRHSFEESRSVVVVEELVVVSVVAVVVDTLSDYSGLQNRSGVVFQLECIVAAVDERFEVDNVGAVTDDARRCEGEGSATLRRRVGVPGREPLGDFQPPPALLVIRNLQSEGIKAS
ncbi:hypothetical protein HDU76_013821 [Blyttiomyces sp. JEL0837]|nr:hypothetical protein HDU76_013821 [Blyttiomyces sp. JEL0837]